MTFCPQNLWDWYQDLISRPKFSDRYRHWKKMVIVSIPTQLSQISMLRGAWKKLICPQKSSFKVKMTSGLGGPYSLMSNVLDNEGFTAKKYLLRPETMRPKLLRPILTIFLRPCIFSIPIFLRQRPRLVFNRKIFDTETLKIIGKVSHRDLPF